MLDYEWFSVPRRSVLGRVALSDYDRLANQSGRDPRTALGEHRQREHLHHSNTAARYKNVHMKFWL